MHGLGSDSCFGNKMNCLQRCEGDSEGKYCIAIPHGINSTLFFWFLRKPLSFILAETMLWKKRRTMPSKFSCSKTHAEQWHCKVFFKITHSPKRLDRKPSVFTQQCTTKSHLDGLIWIRWSPNLFVLFPFTCCFKPFSLGDSFVYRINLVVVASEKIWFALYTRSCVWLIVFFRW